MMSFSNWLRSELDQRQWSQADLAEKSKTTNATISRLVNGSRNPGPEICLAIASALNYPPDFVFKQAGILPPEKDKSPTLEEANQLLDELPEEYQRQALSLIRFLHKTYGPGNPKKAKSTSS